MKILGEYLIGRFGIEFIWHGEAIMWLWPWRWRKAGGRFISSEFDGVFNDLAEIDELWDEYFQAMGDQSCEPWAD